MPSLEDLLFGLGTIYLFFVFTKQIFKRHGEAKSASLAIALFLIPLLVMVHYLGRWDFADDSAFNQPGSWWVVQVNEPETVGEGDDAVTIPPRNFNLITGGLVLCMLYLFATALVGMFSWYYQLKRNAHLLAIRKILIKLAVLLLGSVIYLKSKGIDLTPLWVGMGAASLIVGFALQEPLSNLFKGVALDIEGVIRRGDWIRVGGESGIAGQVVEKNWRTTKINTIDDELVIIPNSIVGSEQIINYNQPLPTHVHRIQIGASYNDPPIKVKEVLRTILIRQPNVEREPPPVIRTINYNDFSIDYELKFWIRDYGRHPGVKDAIRTQIWYAFKFYGIEIPFPIRTVHMKEKEQLADEDKAIDKRMENMREFLLTLPFFNSCLKYTDFEFLARNCFQRRYAAGEHIVHKGEMGDALYIVRDGWVEALLPDGTRRRIDAGSYFGEMGLISLQPRTVDVVAGPESGTTIRIDKECMQILFKRYPELVKEFERIKTERMRDSGFVAPEQVVERVSLPVKVVRELWDFLKPW